MMKSEKIKLSQEYFGMSDLKQVAIGGIGGQGVVLAGSLFGYAAIIDGKYASGANEYGSQARGGIAKSNVVISTEPIIFPHVIEPDIFVALSQGAYNKEIDREITGNITIIYDEPLITPDLSKNMKHIGIPATDKAINELRNKQVVNILLLGATAAITGITTKSSLISAIQKNVTERFIELNCNALEVGYEMGLISIKDLD